MTTATEILRLAAAVLLLAAVAGVAFKLCRWLWLSRVSVWCDVAPPIEGDTLLGFRLRVYRPTNLRWARVCFGIAQIAENRGREPLNFGDIVAASVLNAVEHVADWEGLTEKGKPLPCDKATKTRVFTELPWLADMVGKIVAEMENDDGN